MSRLIAIEPGFFSLYDDLPQKIKKKLRKQLAFLIENPKHPSLKIHQLEGSDFWELYVDRGYRCVFKQEGSIYKLYFVGAHKLIDRF
jgi:mRNA-degrading endonuclease RelE of RelBE toxin-antitoxin system